MIWRPETFRRIASRSRAGNGKKEFQIMQFCRDGFSLSQPGGLREGPVLSSARKHNLRSQHPLRSAGQAVCFEAVSAAVAGKH